jgi:hypothetical protein
MPGKSIYEEANPFDLAAQIAYDQSTIFLKEIKKEGIKEILAKAKGGDKRAIHDLVLWEKTAISLNFVVEEIAAASLNGDKEFIEHLADALKQKVYDKRKDRNRLYVKMLRHLIPFIKVRYGLNVRQAWKMLTEVQNNKAIRDFFETDLFKGGEVSSLYDIDYFVKFLKRSKIIP